MTLSGILLVGSLASLLVASVVWNAAIRAGKNSFECLMFAAGILLSCLAVVASIAPALAAEDAMAPSTRKESGTHAVDQSAVSPSALETTGT
ncbi:hypothetical protein ABZ461_27230 [Actinacidiphila glaucinigra]|uniref:hypothetical protein n=1 Tax=Actinacidiphila glaucinigra TaxID=235986 RepID=UPI0033C825B2